MQLEIMHTVKLIFGTAIRLTYKVTRSSLMSQDPLLKQEDRNCFNTLNDGMRREDLEDTEEHRKLGHGPSGLWREQPRHYPTSFPFAITKARDLHCREDSNGNLLETACIDVVGHERFGETCCVHLHPKAWYSETSISYHMIIRRYYKEDHDLKHKTSDIIKGDYK
jgi:hypothetical protein